MGVFHHHDDLKQHNDCQICTVQSSIANADTPVETLYVSSVHLASESIITTLTHLCSSQTQRNIQVRAPPFIS